MSPHITAEWLKSVGFRQTWSKDEHHPHWVLWVGDSRRAFSGSDDIGLEISPPYHADDGWMCWFRSDASHSRGRFCYVRTLVTQEDVVRLFEGVTGERWEPSRVSFGSFRYPGQRIEEPVSNPAVPNPSDNPSPSTREKGVI